MRESLLLDPELTQALRAAGVRTPGDLLSLAGTGAEHRVTTFVDLPVEGTTGRFYLKRYHYPGWRTSKGLLGRGTLWGRAPEIQEYLALRRLRACGVPAVRPVAAAARWRHGRLLGHALLTEAVPDTQALDVRLHTRGDLLRESPARRRSLVQSIGRAMRWMHDAGFQHRDCHARNVIVRVRREGDDVDLWWLDCRRARFPQGLHRIGTGAPLRMRMLLDVATLDRDLQGALTRTERRRGLEAYLGGDRAKAKDVVRRIAALRDRLPPPRRPPSTAH